MKVNSGPARIVWGHPCKPQNKTDQNKQPVLKDGQPVQQWVFGLAIPRAHFEQVIWPVMAAEAQTGYPQGFPPQFSWKYKDGDQGVDRQGKPYNQREGYAGHIVLTVSTEAFAPSVHKWEGAWRQMQPQELKTGDFVDVELDFKVNVPKNSSHTPGLYVNPGAIAFVGHGQEIVSQGADPSAAFGNAPQWHMPPGASATPVGPAAHTGMPPAPGAMPGYPAPAAAPGYAAPAPAYAPPAAAPAPGYPQPGAPATMPGYPAPAPMAAPGQLPPPAHDFVQNAGYPAPAPAPAYAPPAAPGYPAPAAAPGGMPQFPGQLPPR